MSEHRDPRGRGDGAPKRDAEARALAIAIWVPRIVVLIILVAFILVAIDL